MQKTITFIGAGNMARSLIAGLVDGGYDAKKIWATNPTNEKLQNLKTDFGIHVTQDNCIGAEHADVIVIAVKPKMVKEVVAQLSPILKKRKPLVISVASMIPLALLAKWLGNEIPVIRCMPNTPAKLALGASVLYADHDIEAIHKKTADTILQKVGITVWIEDESQLDAATALSGCGPAYFYLLIEVIQQAGEKLGLPHEIARQLSLQTALGASKMASESEEDVIALRQHVTSKGGNTEAAIKVLEAGNIRELFYNALAAAKQRSEDMAQQFSQG